MNRLRAAFQRLQSQNKKAFVPYITPEFPVSGTTVPLIVGLEKAGASFIEVGIPFSDPIADGPTIQHSSLVALRNGVTVSKILEAVSAARRLTDLPIVLMGYMNPILRYGIEEFLRDAQDAGVDGVIVPDLLPDEGGDWRTMSQQHAISDIFLVAPTTPDKRIRYIDSLASDFTYCVSVTGVTGARTSLGESTSLDKFLRRVKNNTTKPFVVGFGISNREQAQAVCRYADGVVVGSALLQSIENERSVHGTVREAGKFFSSLVS